MKSKITQTIKIPEGIQCTFESKILKCKKDSLEIEREISLPATSLKIENNEITLECEKGNKNHYKFIKTTVAHINNLLKGLEEPFVYKLEAANVHFPMTLKVQSGFLEITNFLGEKIPRSAKILQNVEVEVKGQEITVTSPSKESAGQTAANFEKATRLTGRDRRIFQDGVYITEKPGGKI